MDNGMQDYNYIFTNCMEVTAELSCTKQPEASKLQREWENNLDSMLTFLGAVHGGVKGRVLDENGVPVADALIDVLGRDKVLGFYFIATPLLVLTTRLSASENK